jgi:GGDEF domain-containing protein
VAFPRIPDEAFREAAGRVDRLFDVVLAASPSEEQAREAGDNFCRALGLDGERDERAHALAERLLAVVRDGHTPEDVDATVLGITLGLQLAQATGWEAPIDDAGPR